MRSRQILGFAIFCGAMGTLGGQTVQAQAPSSQRFVQLLLMNQSTQISADMKAVNKRNMEIAQLEAATSSRQISKLAKSLTKLNREILAMTANLQLLSIQTVTLADALAPSNPGLVSTAVANLLTVQTISVQAGLGVSPATPSQ